jgi:hypothetical protein
MSTSNRTTVLGLSALSIVTGLVGLLAVGCSPPMENMDEMSDEELTQSFDDALTNAQKKSISDHIKNVAATHGVTNSVLFAGVPNHETGLVQCWKDATWACKGPASDYCGGPVIAGSGDGPCSQKQGGLGIYQLDAGTYSQTLASYGKDIVELDAQIDEGVDIIISKVWHCPNTPHFDTEAEVIAWINAAKPGTAKYEVFLSAMAYCYNGTPPSSSNFQNMRSKYRAGVQKLVDAFGKPYWATAEIPKAPPAGHAACYAKCANRAAYHVVAGVTSGCTAAAKNYCSVSDRGTFQDAAWGAAP